ncbi:MAG TPA: twin-arginine translocation signal domain-containing protein [Candidatus Acidoferrum sp.]|nr:twin-arginine translocation signal domain-containing protein [Candidatus Acidoferrum sp.]
MSDKKLIDSITGMEPTRRSFLKGALMLGGALALALPTGEAMAQDAPTDGTKKKKKKGKKKKKSTSTTN